jgi:hypothetical protein
VDSGQKVGKLGLDLEHVEDSKYRKKDAKVKEHAHSLGSHRGDGLFPSRHSLNISSPYFFSKESSPLSSRNGFITGLEMSFRGCEVRFP